MKGKAKRRHAFTGTLLVVVGIVGTAQLAFGFVRSTFLVHFGDAPHYHRRPTSLREHSQSDTLPSKLLLLHVAYDGSQYKVWRDLDTPEDQNFKGQRLKKRSRPPRRTLSLHHRLGTTLSIIHSHVPPHSLQLTPALLVTGGAHAESQLISYRPPALPFNGDLNQTAHALNRLLPADVRVLEVLFPPWDQFCMSRDLVSVTYSYTIILGGLEDPTLRHYARVYHHQRKEWVEEGIKRLQAIFGCSNMTVEELLGKGGERDAGAGQRLLSATMEAGWGPGIGKGRARLARFELEVEGRRSENLDDEKRQTMVVEWVNTVVGEVFGGERKGVGGTVDRRRGDERSGFNGLVLKSLLFRQRGEEKVLWTLRSLARRQEGGENHKWGGHGGLSHRSKMRR